MKEKTFSDPLEPLSEDANRAMLGCCEELAKDASDAMWMMDDIVRRAEENIRLWNDNNKYARLIRKAYECKFGKPKEIDMEEKKTKTMTKAEAFEYFKKKKILAKEKDANIGVQEKLFQCGIEWAGGGSVPLYYSDYLIVEESGRLYHCGLDDRYWFAHHYESIDADDILSMGIVEEDKGPLDRCEEFASKVAKIQETLGDDEVCIITKTNFLTMMK